MDIVILLLGVSILLVILYIFVGDDKTTIGRKQKIAVLMLYDENIKDYADIAYKINKKYCEKYDIELIKEYNKKYTDRIPHWQKVPMVLEYMKNYDYVIWIDADAFFYLDAGDIRNVINMYKDKNIIFSKDYLNEAINSGFFIVKNCKESIDFVNKWAYDEDVFNNSQYGHDPIQGDQGGLTNMYHANDFGVKKWSVRLDYGVLQHFPAARDIHTFKKKPYVCHMAGDTRENRNKIIKEYYDTYIGDKESYNPDTKTHIPKTIYQCYHDKSKIPPKVYHSKSTLAPNYKHKIYDDDECRNFLRQYYGENYVDIFNYLLKDGTPAHAADFWRYCILYKYGGVYLDIKIELIESMDDTVKRLGDCTFSTVLATIPMMGDACVQSVIISAPRHPILKQCIDDIIQTYKKARYEYHTYTRLMYKNISIYTNIKQLKEGRNGDVFLYKEICPTNQNGDYIWDRCSMTYNGNKHIKTRYADYPW